MVLTLLKAVCALGGGWLGIPGCANKRQGFARGCDVCMAAYARRARETQQRARDSADYFGVH